MIQTSTLRPGLLVSLKTTISGNVKYQTTVLEESHATGDGALKARWETERTVLDAAEHEDAKRARNKARTEISRLCAESAFGLLCPDAKISDLETAVVTAREIADQFNRGARVTRISVYVMTGRIAPDDVEAVRAINSEVRDLLERMERGARNLDVEEIRKAANAARGLGAMLSPAAAERVQTAIDAARGAARQIVKAGETAAVFVDELAIKRISESRLAFLDLDDEREVSAPTVEARGLDFEPEDLPPAISAARATPAQAALMLEF